MTMMTSLFNKSNKSFDLERNLVRTVSKEQLASVDQKILTSQEIISDYIDWDSLQSFEDFSKKNEVRFLPGDFCLQLSEKTILKLRNEGRIDLSEVDKIGWFGKEKHNERWSSFKTLNNFVAIEIKSSIEHLEICNFSQFKRNIINVAETDALKGGLGISYFYEKKEYENFLSKIIWRENQWRISSEDLEPEFSIPILLQLVLFQSNRDSKFFIEISKSIDKEYQNYFLLLNEVLSISLNYFSTRSFQGKNHYLGVLIKGFREKKVDTKQLQSEVDNFILELDEMRFVHNEGVIYNPKRRLSKIVNDFINLSDIGTEKLKESLDSSTKNYSITVYFLLGMMHLYSRTQKQFYIKSLIHYIVSVTSHKISDIEFGDNYISLIFSIPVNESVWNTQFKFIKEHFDMIKEIKGFTSNTAELKRRYKERKDQLNPELKGYEKEIESIKKDIKNQKIKKIGLEEDLNLIIDDIIAIQNEKHAIKKSSSLDSKEHYASFKSEFIKTQNWRKFQKDFNALLKNQFKEFINNLEQDKDIQGFKASELEKNNTGAFYLKNLKNKEYIIDLCIENWKNKNQKPELAKDIKPHSKESKDTDQNLSKAEFEHKEFVEFEHKELGTIHKVSFSDKEMIEKCEKDTMWIRNN